MRLDNRDVSRVLARNTKGLDIFVISVVNCCTIARCWYNTVPSFLPTIKL